MNRHQANRNARVRRRLLPAAFMALVLVLAACGDDAADDGAAPPTDEPGAPDCDVPGTCEPSEELIAAAQAEGEVVTYSAIGAATMERFAEAFQEKYGITLNFTVTLQAEALERFQAEFDSGNQQGDVIMLADPALYEEWAGDGFIKSFTLAEVPNAGALPDERYGPGGGEYGWFMWGGPIFTLGWNNDFVPASGPPSSYCDLVDPDWHGLVGMSDQRSTTAYVHHQAVKELCGEDYFVNLAANGLKFYPGTIQALEALAAGEIAAFNHAIPYLADSFIEAGANIEFATDEVSTMSTRWSAVVEGGPHPNAALLFANFLLSAEAQQIAFSPNFGLSVLPRELVPEQVEVEGQLFESTLQEAALYEEQILRDLGRL